MLCWASQSKHITDKALQKSLISLDVRLCVRFWSEVGRNASLNHKISGSGHWRHTYKIKDKYFQQEVKRCTHVVSNLYSVFSPQWNTKKVVVFFTCGIQQQFIQCPEAVNEINVFCTGKWITYKFEMTLWTQNQAQGCLETAEMDLTWNKFMSITLVLDNLKLFYLKQSFLKSHCFPVGRARSQKVVVCLYSESLGPCVMWLFFVSHLILWVLYREKWKESCCQDERWGSVWRGNRL